jgi:hypothetical protein
MSRREHGISSQKQSEATEFGTAVLVDTSIWNISCSSFDLRQTTLSNQNIPIGHGVPYVKSNEIQRSIDRRPTT